MNHLLEQAFNEAAKLPDEEQQAFAEWIVEELEERRWQKKFADSRDALRRAAAQALADDEAGLTEPLDLDNL